MTERERVIQIVDALAPELKTLALNIHDNPELGLQEFKACAWQKELLAKYGFQIEDDFCNLETAYKAVYKGKKQGPKIAFLAEYDALPGLGHGCGHNLIAMVAVGCGIACREFADKYGAEIDVIGTPAEETAGTKVPMSAMGVFKDYDAVMMAHPDVLQHWIVLTVSRWMPIKSSFLGNRRTRRTRRMRESTRWTR